MHHGHRMDKKLLLVAQYMSEIRRKQAEGAQNHNSTLHYCSDLVPIQEMQITSQFHQEPSVYRKSQRVTAHSISVVQLRQLYQP